MVRKSIWVGIGAFILALLVSFTPSDRMVALSDISLGGAPAQAKKGDGHGPSHHRPYRPDLPSIFDTLEELDLDADDGGGPDDDDDGPDDDGGQDDDDGGPDDD